MEMLAMEPWPPDGALLVCEFVTIGHPRTAGSKTSFVPRRGDGSQVTRPDGRPMVVTKDSSGKEGEAWRSDVAAAALAAFEFEDTEIGLLDGPLALDLTFVLQRPKSHYRTGRNAHLLRDAAPSAPATKPDALKLARAVEDSLTTVVWRDDALVVDGRQRKVFGTPERVEVRVFKLGGPPHDAQVDGQERLIAA